jgi:hypothetical protein
MTQFSWAFKHYHDPLPTAPRQWVPEFRTGDDRAKLIR